MYCLFFRVQLNIMLQKKRKKEKGDFYAYRDFYNRRLEVDFLGGVTNKPQALREQRQFWKLFLLLPSVPCSAVHTYQVCLLLVCFGPQWGLGKSVYMCAYFTRCVVVLVLSPHVSSCCSVYVTPMEPTTGLGDLNTDSELVFSLASDMTFTFIPPWWLAWISHLSYLASLVWACLCVFVPSPWIVMSIRVLTSSEKPSANRDVCWTVWVSVRFWLED